jgi:hypothetical protein
LWTNPNSFDKVYTGGDVVFRDVRVTAVCRRIELSASLEAPKIKVVDPKEDDGGEDVQGERGYIISITRDGRRSRGGCHVQGERGYTIILVGGQ